MIKLMDWKESSIAAFFNKPVASELAFLSSVKWGQIQALVFGTQHKALKEVTTVSKSSLICNQICSSSHFLFVSMDNHESRQISSNVVLQTTWFVGLGLSLGHQYSMHCDIIAWFLSFSYHCGFYGALWWCYPLKFLKFFMYPQTL